MQKADIIETINEFLVDEFEVEEELIEEKANLHETLDLDSLDYVDLIVVIEDKFGFKVTKEDFVDIATFEDFYNYIDGKVNAKVA